MKKLLTVIVPLALLVAFASVSLASEEEQELNEELNGTLDGSGVRVVDDQANEDEDSGFEPTELNDPSDRETRSLAVKRGRQPRRGQTASELSEAQKYWGDHGSGKSDDEMADEDEDGDETPMYP